MTPRGRSFSPLHKKQTEDLFTLHPRPQQAPSAPVSQGPRGPQLHIMRCDLCCVCGLSRWGSTAVCFACVVLIIDPLGELIFLMPVCFQTRHCLQAGALPALLAPTSPGTRTAPHLLGAQYMSDEQTTNELSNTKAWKHDLCLTPGPVCSQQGTLEASSTFWVPCELNQRPMITGNFLTIIPWIIKLDGSAQSPLQHCIPWSKGLHPFLVVWLATSVLWMICLHHRGKLRLLPPSGPLKQPLRTKLKKQLLSHYNLPPYYVLSSCRHG